jgi:hypothetical protein
MMVTVTTTQVSKYKLLHEKRISEIGKPGSGLSGDRVGGLIFDALSQV